MLAVPTNISDFHLPKEESGLQFVQDGSKDSDICDLESIILRWYYNCSITASMLKIILLDISAQDLEGKVKNICRTDLMIPFDL